MTGRELSEPGFVELEDYQDYYLIALVLSSSIILVLIQ